MTILDEIVRDVRRRVEVEKNQNPLSADEVERSGDRSLREAIEDKDSGASVIGELKRMSPSTGRIRDDFRVNEVAEAMVRGGVVGISVLTEPDYFDGRPEFIEEVRRSVDTPVLRKDFIVDQYQLYRSAEMGADAVLLIGEVLGGGIPDFVDKARKLGMESLVEVRSKEQAEIARLAEADLVGINNRNLSTMEVDISTTERLVKYLPRDAISVSESGIETGEDVERALGVGVDAVLVGTAIMRSNDIESKVRDLVSGGSKNG